MIFWRYTLLALRDMSRSHPSVACLSDFWLILYWLVLFALAVFVQEFQVLCYLICITFTVVQVDYSRCVFWPGYKAHGQQVIQNPGKVPLEWCVRDFFKPPIIHLIQKVSAPGPVKPHPSRIPQQPHPGFSVTHNYFLPLTKLLFPEKWDRQPGPFKSKIATRRRGSKNMAPPTASICRPGTSFFWNKTRVLHLVNSEMVKMNCLYERSH